MRSFGGSQGPKQAPTAQQRYEQLSFGSDLIKPDAPIVHNQFLKRSVHWTRFPDFANDFERHRTILVRAVPFESNFQALRLAIISQALNPTVVHGMVFDWERIQQVLAIHNPVPATRASVRRRCPVVNLVRFCIELAGVHRLDSNVLARCETEAWE